MKKHTWTIVFTCFLLAFTVFLGMDTFVLSSVYQTDVTGMNTEMFPQAEVSVNRAGEDSEEKDQRRKQFRFRFRRKPPKEKARQFIEAQAGQFFEEQKLI